MNTPICDFVHSYAEKEMLRLHMPGHKGVGILGIERLDITEVSGADSLYEANGIIAESEHNASILFGCPTFYSTEGSSQCIRAMLHLATCGKTKRIAAARNVHKTFLSAAALLDLQVDWLYPEENCSYLSCQLEVEDLKKYLSTALILPDAVYITSPDYLGNMLDIYGLSTVCHEFGVLLLVDNAHGAYLRFLPESLHPMDLGADLCCASAHKTLPVLTGGAYLHVRNEGLAKIAKNALSLFGSTSPSYLILQSLDLANPYLSQDYIKQLKEFCHRVQEARIFLVNKGYRITGNEPMKLTIAPKSYGYTGVELADLLRQQGIECEFADPDYIVFMFALTTGTDGLSKLLDALAALEQKDAILSYPPPYGFSVAEVSIRQALLCPAKEVQVESAVGQILASPSVGCPPAVPIAICGERITQNHVETFRYYGIDTIWVIQ